MPALIPLLSEVLGLVLPAMQLGLDISDVITRAKALADAPTPVTADELAALAAMIAAERAKLTAMTAELERD